MANVQIPNLPAAISLNGDEQLEAVQAGTTRRITTGQIAALAQGVPLPFPVSIGGTGAATFTAGYLKANGTNPFTTVATIPNTDITGLGTMSTQNSNSVSITGGSISGVTITTSTPLAISSGGTGQTTASAAANALDGYLTVVSAAGITTLTNTSARVITVTGTLGQTIQLPDVTTLALGWTFTIINLSTSPITPQSSGGNNFATIFTGCTARLTCIAVTGTGVASWVIQFFGNTSRTGTGATVYATQPALVSPSMTTAVANQISGGTVAASTLTLQSTTGAGTTDAIIFNTGSQLERMRITTAGNVGIGVTNPSAPLQIFGTTQNRLWLSSAAINSRQLFVRSNGTFAAPTIVASGNDIGSVNFFGYDGAANIELANMLATVDGTPGLNDMPGRLTFSTTADGASAPTERFRIGSAGQLGIAGANYGTATQYMKSGGASAAPSWATIANTDISGLGTMSTQNANSVSITGGSITGITDLAVADGGTGASSFTTDGILYGAGAGAILATAQGGANTILTANAGAPSFSASPTIGTSVTVPAVFGGTAVGSILAITSTSGAGTSDAILFDTGSQVERIRIDSTGVIAYFQPAQVSKAAAATLTNVELRSRIIQYTGAAATLTLPTGTNLEGVTGSTQSVDTAFEVTFINTSANLLTIGANGNTTVGTLTVAANTSGTFRFRKTATNTFTVYRVA